MDDLAPFRELAQDYRRREAEQIRLSETFDRSGKIANHLRARAELWAEAAEGIERVLKKLDDA